MSKDKIYPEERLLKIMKKIKKEISVDVEQLAMFFDVTGATIRADLRELEQRNLITRTHGGAILRGILNESLKQDRDPAYNRRLLENVDLKEAIGSVAASLINDGDSIMLDDGSTTLQVAKNLPLDKRITVITNGLNICLELAEHSNVNVIATGGNLNKSDLSYHGKVAGEVTARYNASKAILGASGISISSGITAPDDEKSELKKIMIKNSEQLIIVADHTKLNKISLVSVALLDEMSTLVTDSKALPEAIEMFEKKGIKVIIADV